MGFYDTEENVEKYAEMAEGIDGAEHIAVLATFLKAGSSVLELGMGVGKDVVLLEKAGYTVTPTDASQAFVDRYNKQNPKTPATLLDAVAMDVDGSFNCFYSNKVLHHLTKDELKQSFERSFAKLNDGGLICHSFWYGDNEENYSGMFVQNHTEESLKELLPANTEVLYLERYKEFEDADSLLLIARKK